jgi:hypothetical protein
MHAGQQDLRFKKNDKAIPEHGTRAKQKPPMFFLHLSNLTQL